MHSLENEITDTILNIPTKVFFENTYFDQRVSIFQTRYLRFKYLFKHN